MCRGAGIGLQRRLKIVWEKSRVGSSPTRGTIVGSHPAFRSWARLAQTLFEWRVPPSAPIKKAPKGLFLLKLLQYYFISLLFLL